MGIDIFDFIGQKHIINELDIHMTAALKKQRPIEHCMFYGPAGLGKTTLAGIIAQESGWNFVEKMGKELTRKEIYRILRDITYKDVFFVDEIHRTPIASSELLYGPLQCINNLNLESEQGKTYVFEGVEMNRFTFIGATTTAGMLPRPLRERIIHTFEFHPYSIEELSHIMMERGCPQEPSLFIAQRCRGIARLAINFVTQIRNLADSINKIKIEHCTKLFDIKQIDELGLNESDRKILFYLSKNTTAGLEELSYATNIDIENISDMHEPFLMQIGLLHRTQKGRQITNKAKQYLARYS